MIKDVFVLSKNSWHMKLMKWVWNLDHRDFSHICPYFWMSVLNLVIVIPLSAIRLLLWCIKTPFSKLQTYIDRKEQANFDRWIEQLTKDPDKIIEETARLCDKDYDRYEEYILTYDRKQRWGSPPYVIRSGPGTHEYWTKLDDARDAYKSEKRRGERVREAEYYISAKARKAKINSIIKYVKPIAMGIVWIVLSGLALLALWGLYHFVLMISSIKGKYWLAFAEILGTVVLVILAIILLAKTIAWTYNRISCSTMKAPRWLRYLKYLLYPIVWLIAGTVTIWDIISTMVANSCPYIDWKEDK